MCQRFCPFFCSSHLHQLTKIHHGSWCIQAGALSSGGLPIFPTASALSRQNRPSESGQGRQNMPRHSPRRMDPSFPVVWCAGVDTLDLVDQSHGWDPAHRSKQPKCAFGPRGGWCSWDGSSCFERTRYEALLSVLIYVRVCMYTNDSYVCVYTYMHVHTYMHVCIQIIHTGTKMTKLSTSAHSRFQHTCIQACLHRAAARLVKYAEIRRKICIFHSTACISVIYYLTAYYLVRILPAWLHVEPRRAHVWNRLLKYAQISVSHTIACCMVHCMSYKQNTAHLCVFYKPDMWTRLHAYPQRNHTSLSVRHQHLQEKHNSLQHKFL